MCDLGQGAVVAHEVHRELFEVVEDDLDWQQDEDREEVEHVVDRRGGEGPARVTGTLRGGETNVMLRMHVVYKRVRRCTKVYEGVLRCTKVHEGTGGTLGGRRPAPGSRWST